MSKSKQSGIGEAFTATTRRRNQVNLHLTDDELQVLMKQSLETGLRVGVLARFILSKGISEEAARAAIAKAEGGSHE